MPDERVVRAAERAKLEAAVAEHGTEAEKASLLFSAIRRSGVTLTRLAEADETGESIGWLRPDPELVTNLTRRVERRSRLKLPQAECAADPPTPYCDCLERALDEPGDEGKRAVLKLARAFHRKRVEPIPAPAPRPAEPQETNAELVSAPPPAEPQKPRAEPLVRVVHRTRKWFDPKPQSFRDMKF